MAHYAFLDENNIVQEVTVGVDETETAPEGFGSWEEYYQSIKGVTCKRTSYNTVANTHTDGGTAFRGNYAGIGYVYDTDNDVFYPQQPYPSWVLNNTSWIWEAPIDLPNLTQEQIDAGNYHTWDEDAYQADNTQGWVLNS